MRVLVPLSDHPYYLWQALVQAVWLRDGGWDVSYLVYCQRQPSARLRKLMGAGLADWTVWTDWRTAKTYNAAMKPWLVGKWLTAHPDPGPVLVLDPDALPTGAPLPEAVPGVLHGTDTDSYTGAGYLADRAALAPLVELLGVDVEQARAFPGVGAQYIFDGIPGEWWEQVARDSVSAHALLSSIPSPDSGFAVQAWCAEMYVTHLAAVRDGYAPRAEPSMSMVWAAGHRDDWDTHGFFHNAGVERENGRDFCKVTHQRSPWRTRQPVHSESASARYVELIRAVEVQHPDLTWK